VAYLPPTRGTRQCPVSGGVEGAEAGTLSIMVGGEERDAANASADTALRSVSHPEVYAVGDAAAVRQSYGVIHGTCQSGIPTAARAAGSIARIVKGQRTGGLGQRQTPSDVIVVDVRLEHVGQPTPRSSNNAKIRSISRGGAAAVTARTDHIDTIVAWQFIDARGQTAQRHQLGAGHVTVHVLRGLAHINHQRPGSLRRGELLHIHFPNHSFLQYGWGI
jgi:NADH dehydrogenase FAD-containing subunit